MKTFIIYALAIVILFFIFRQFGKSNYSGSSLDDVKTMLKSGMSEINVIVNLIKSGVPSDQAEQMVAQAK
jgi:hypothetical protein